MYDIGTMLYAHYTSIKKEYINSKKKSNKIFLYHKNIKYLCVTFSG